MCALYSYKGVCHETAAAWQSPALALLSALSEELGRASAAVGALFLGVLRGILSRARFRYWLLYWSVDITELPSKKRHTDMHTLNPPRTHTHDCARNNNPCAAAGADGHREGA